jgi:hypothetical protein
MRKRLPGPSGAPPRPLLFLYRALLVLALALGLVILGGTLVAVFRGPGGGDRAASNGPLPGGGADGPGGEGGPEAAGEAVFTGIGRLRIPLAAPGDGAGQPAGNGRAALVISISFPYSPRDRALSEELTAKAGDFRRIAREYFSAYSVEELRSLDEETLKAGLLGAYNSTLRLGKIGSLYFHDLLLFE